MIKVMELGLTLVLSGIALIIGISLFPSIDTVVNGLGIGQLEGYLTLVFTVILLVGMLVFMRMFAGLGDEYSESYTEPDWKEGLHEESKPKPKTENCKNCGGPNVDRVTCEWCGNVLE